MNRVLRASLKMVAIMAACLVLASCDYKLFDPKGPVAETQMWLLIGSALIMLIVVVPVTVMGIWFPYRYRKGNTSQEYKPDWEHSNKIEAIVWTIPIFIIIVLGVITYITSFSLDPRKPIESDKPTKVIQVVALDWKWLFIYPEEEIATINEIAIPVDTPVQFLITSDTVMNSFFIPHLGTQIYAMSGMENRLHLMATEEGVFPGFSSNYSGFGFSGMKFSTIATSDEGYDAWVEKVRNSENPLDENTMARLREKSRDEPAAYFSTVDPLLFSEVIGTFKAAVARPQLDH